MSLHAIFLTNKKIPKEIWNLSLQGLVFGAPVFFNYTEKKISYQKGRTMEGINYNYLHGYKNKKVCQIQPKLTCAQGL